MRGSRFVLYAHDGMGLGHTQRSLTIAGALTAADPTTAVLLATGSEALDLFDLPAGVDVLKLPALRKVTNGDYVSRRLSLTRPEIASLRSALLDAAIVGFEPDVILADKHPGGASGELLAALESTSRRGGTAVLGLRDVLDSPAVVKAEWQRESAWQTIDRYYSRVLVYGQPTVVDHVQAYAVPAKLGRRFRYCGYVTKPLGETAEDPASRSAAHPLVIATAGGGEDGNELFDAFLAAARGAGWDAHLVAGPMASECGTALAERCREARVTFHSVLPQMARHLALADAVVCMGGYNTLLEVAVAGTPTVCVPRRYPRTEQTIRAEAFQQLGILRSLPQPDGDQLRSAVEAALLEDRSVLRAIAYRELDLNGAVNAAAMLHQLAASEPVAAVAGGAR